ncbi:MULTISPECIES: OsmC family protein [unclassified Plantactinospora]|uniref:OsmC family protein n=1 Tax=unclassified Plantactinospora TaxID=2631981 RepID=UPI000D16A11E|nr:MULTISPECIES: OsmC family protein [unclassified Plantactinospora]AVT28540.1 osmotically inducible protein OsmC [Plantactinospora sp. BC1]AVT38224.1 osmotically inducible protein OsmC [Plantactinospora sp. BB1]
MPESEAWVHEATATAEGGRLRTDDGELSTTLASPLAPHCTGLAPEQLLAAAFASCLHHAAVEAATGITDEAHTVQVRAQARLARDADGLYRADVRASIASVGLNRDQLTDLARYADRLWPFSSDGGRHTLTVGPAEPGQR